MSEVKKPSEKVLINKFDGVELIDSLGRKLRLKKPDILDRYDLMSAMGEDSKSPMCLSYAFPMLHIAIVDGMIIEPPKSYSSFRATLKRIGEEGIECVMEYLNKIHEEKNDAEVMAAAKK
jgi:hypothetical protein